MTDILFKLMGACSHTSGGSPSDVTPSNSSWWNNISTGNSNGSTNSITILGINTSITLEASFTRDRDAYTLTAVVNDSTVDGPDSAPGTLTFNVTNGDVIRFEASGGETRNSVATVTNITDNNTVLDTFNIDLQN